MLAIKRPVILVSLILLFVLLLCSCLSNLWTGANLVYDRHDVYKKMGDYHLIIETNKALYPDKILNCNQCVIDIAVFNQDILVVGHVPSGALLQVVQRRLARVKGYRRLFNQVTIKQDNGNHFQDSWITAKIRGQIFADSTIDPKAFKIVTSDGVVYLMGDVKGDEAKKVIEIARFTNGVNHVVKIFKYYVYKSGNEAA